MQWTAPTRRHLGAKMVVFNGSKLPLLAKSGSLRDAAGTSAYPPTTDMKNGDVRFDPNYFRFAPNNGRF